MKNTLKKEKSKNLLQFFVDYYKRFPIPWWAFIMNTLLGMVSTELSLKLASIMISVNKGELYNSVIISYALLYVLDSVIAYVTNLFYYYGSETVVYRARLVIWKHILHLPVKDIEREKPSSLISATTNDSGSASQSIGYLFLMFRSLYTMVRALYTLVSFNATLSVYMLLTIPGWFLVFWANGKTTSYGYKKSRIAVNEMTMFFAEHVSAAKYVKASAMEDKELKSGYAAIERGFWASVLNAFLSNIQVTLFHTNRNISVVLIALFGSDLIRQGKMEQTGINDFSTYMNKVDQTTSELLTHYQTFKGCQATLGRVSQLLDMPAEDPNAGADWQQAEAKDIVFENVSFGYTADREVLHDVSLRIPAGKVTAIVGDNGCGKSTVMKLMQGFYQANSGTITVAGNQVGDVKLSQLRSHFGYVLQNNELFAASLRDNMTYGVPGEVSDEQIALIGRKACLTELADTLAEGYDTVIGESGSSLSGGQRQRIAIARAMLQKPDFLLLDEAGSALDYQTYQKIQSSIKEEMQGKTTVFIAHDMREIMTADYVIVMDQGRIEATGTHEELMKTSATYQDYMSRLSEEEAAV